jgi:hypothetical protein
MCSRIVSNPFMGDQVRWAAPVCLGQTRSWLARDRVPRAARVCPDLVPWAARCLDESGAGPSLARAEARSLG